MKSKLVVLTDLWGLKKSSWLEHYHELLKSDFELIVYDSCKLAEIENEDLNEQQLHSRFIDGGIKTAVGNIIKSEQGPLHILAFSMGGTIAWKAGINGLSIINLYAVSSTRLRYETDKPNCKINLIYGEKDRFKPDINWADHQKLKLEIIKDGEHEIYKNSEVIESICERIKGTAQY